MDVLFVEIVIPGRPRAWMRSGGLGKIRFEPAEQRSSKGVIQFHAIEAIKRLGLVWPIDWHYKLRIDAYWPMAQGEHRKREPARMYPKASRPDWDNLGKLVSDALNALVWADDGQIVDARVLKWTANQGEPPRTVIKVWAFRPGSEWRDLIGRDS